MCSEENNIEIVNIVKRVFGIIKGRSRSWFQLGGESVNDSSNGVDSNNSASKRKVSN